MANGMQGRLSSFRTRFWAFHIFTLGPQLPHNQASSLTPFLDMASIGRAHAHLQSEAPAFPGVSFASFCYPIPPTAADSRPSSTQISHDSCQSWRELDAGARATHPNPVLSSFRALAFLSVCGLVGWLMLSVFISRNRELETRKEMAFLQKQLAQKSARINALSIEKREVDKENHLFSLKLDKARTDLRESQRSTNAALAEVQGLTESLKAVQTALKRDQVTTWANQAKLSDLQAAFNTQKIQCDAAYKECDSLRAQLSEKQRHVQILEAKISSIQVDAQQARSAFNECNRLRAQLANRERSVQVLEARLAQLEEFVRAKEREVEEEHRRGNMSEAEREQETRLDNWRHATADEVRRCHERDAQWPLRTWNQSRALERFHFVADEFAKMEFRFSESRPLTAGTVPWPVLHHPQALRSSLDEVGWKSVEEFFGFAQANMANDRFRKLLSTMQRTFHPDKWSSAHRSVLDDGLRGSMEAAIIRVSQAINGIIQFRRF